MLRLKLLFVGCFAAASTSAVAWCDSYPNIRREFAESEIVLVARVRSEAKVNPAGDYFDGINYELEPVEILKGNVREKVKVFSENSSGRFPMKVGGLYLVFASTEADTFAGEPVLTVSYCGNSGPLPESGSKARQARRLAKGSAQRH